jgi:hypothetical protein
MTTPVMDSVTASHVGLLTSCTRPGFGAPGVQVTPRLGLRRLRPGQPCAQARRRQLHSIFNFTTLGRAYYTSGAQVRCRRKGQKLWVDVPLAKPSVGDLAALALARLGSS